MCVCEREKVGLGKWEGCWGYQSSLTKESLLWLKVRMEGLKNGKSSVTCFSDWLPPSLSLSLSLPPTTAHPGSCDRHRWWGWQHIHHHCGPEDFPFPRWDLTFMFIPYFLSHLCWRQQPFWIHSYASVACLSLAHSPPLRDLDWSIQIPGNACMDTVSRTAASFLWIVFKLWSGTYFWNEH